MRKVSEGNNLHAINHIIIPNLICKLQRIVEHIAVAVVVLRVGGVLHKRIGREELGCVGVINPSVHVDEAECRHVFVPGVASVVV